MNTVIRVQKRLLPTLSSSKFIEDFIRIFHQQEPLWNTRHPDYNKRNVREECYDVLVEKMQEVRPDPTREDVTKKINSIRSAFRKEHKKVLRSLARGEKHTPRLWYYNRLLFLLEQEQQQDSDADNGKGEEQSEDMDYDNDPLNVISSQEEPQSAQESTQCHPPRRRRRLQTVTSTQHANGSPESHSSIFGRHVAAKLASVPEDQRVYLEKLINDAIFEAELGNLSRDSGITLH